MSKKRLPDDKMSKNRLPDEVNHSLTGQIEAWVDRLVGCSPGMVECLVQLTAAVAEDSRMADVVIARAKFRISDQGPLRFTRRKQKEYKPLYLIS